MTQDNQMPAGAFESSSSIFASSSMCEGQCLAEARLVYEQALEEAKPLAGSSHSDISKRFQFLYDVSATDKHKEAEIMLENALALYEALYGQEHPSVAKLLLHLSSLYSVHGNADAAQYLTDWANQILSMPQEEPTHEFFHLFGMDELSGNESAPPPENLTGGQSSH